MLSPLFSGLRMCNSVIRSWILSCSPLQQKERINHWLDLGRVILSAHFQWSSFIVFWSLPISAFAFKTYRSKTILSNSYLKTCFALHATAPKLTDHSPVPNAVLPKTDYEGQKNNKSLVIHTHTHTVWFDELTKWVADLHWSLPRKFAEIPPTAPCNPLTATLQMSFSSQNSPLCFLIFPLGLNLFVNCITIAYWWGGGETPQLRQNCTKISRVIIFILECVELALYLFVHISVYKYLYGNIAHLFLMQPSQDIAVNCNTMQ